MAPKKPMLSRIRRKFSFWKKTPIPEATDPPYPPPLPCLAFVRPRPLTAESHDVSGSASSTFFKKLPLDLRLKIMRYAFGYWGIHVELDFNHPPFKMRSHNVTVDGLEVNSRPLVLDQRSCPDPQDSGYSWGRYLLCVDKRQPKAWQWWGGICSLEVSPFDDPRFYCGHMVHTIDVCRTRGFRWWDDTYVGEAMAEIGVMGWLLSCRQAYSEGIRVLYTSNSFLLSNPELILNLPRLFVPPRLACITSLEMVWKIHPFRPQQNDDPVLTDYETFSKLMDATAAYFPSLLQIYISLRGDMYTDPGRRTDMEYNFSEEAFNRVENAVIRPIEDMLKMLNKLTTVVIGLPSSCYGPRKQRAMDAGLEVFENRFGSPETFWRDVPELSSKGYWIRLDHLDMGGGDYMAWGCGVDFVPPTPKPLDCLYGKSMSPW